MSRVKSRDQIAKMRRAGRVVAEMHEEIRGALRPGVTTAHLDEIARAVLQRRGAKSNFFGYMGYPAAICASVNDEIVHGIPGAYRIRDGDVVAIDCGAVLGGWHGDAAFTAGVGRISEVAASLIEVTERSLLAAIDAMVVGNHMGDVGYAVQQTAERAGFSIVEGYTGHAIGRALHENPDVPNHGRPGRGAKLRPGDVFALEPMVNAGSGQTYALEDGWTVKSADGSLSAHFEHTVAVTSDGPEVLTVP